MKIQEGPFLNAALICERVLEEKDGVKSAIRIIDRITHTRSGPNPPKEMEPFNRTLSLLVKLKSGSVRGVYPLKITLISPSGESKPPLEISVNFEGEEDRGIDLIARIDMRFEVPGIYWVEVSLKDDFLSRIPMRVIYIPQVRTGGRPGHRAD